MNYSSLPSFLLFTKLFYSHEEIQTAVTLQTKFDIVERQENGGTLGPWGVYVR
jgi:hypothetical protein